MMQEPNKSEKVRPQLGISNIEKLIDKIGWAFNDPNSALVDFNSVKSLHNILNKKVAIVDPIQLMKLDRLNYLILWFPITCDGEEWLSKWTENVYGASMINFPVKAHNIIMVDSVCGSVSKWIQRLPMMKGHLVHDMYLPDEDILNFCVMHWKPR